MAENITPSSDLRATVIAIAWSIVSSSGWREGTGTASKTHGTEKDVRNAAKLVGEIAQTILASADFQPKSGAQK